MPKLILYHYPSCFFCRRVRNTISGLGLEVELRDIHQDSNWRDELVTEMGRQTVPVLRIEDAEGAVRWMPESRDIVDFLGKL